MRAFQMRNFLTALIQNVQWTTRASICQFLGHLDAQVIVWGHRLARVCPRCGTES